MKSFLFAALTAFIWGIVPVFEKLGLIRAEPNVALFIRCMGVFVGAVFLFFLISPMEAIGKLELKTVIFLLIGGFLASFVG